VPGTVAGAPAIRQLIEDGININVTLLFSNESYVAVAMAFVEAGDDVVQCRLHVLLRQSKDASEHHACTGLLMFEALLAGHEELRDDTRRVGGESQRAAGRQIGLHRGHCLTAEMRRACCMVDSAASVDSAP